jgi:acetyl-CoA carboxylase biotin carboxyl carrier protein
MDLQQIRSLIEAMAASDLAEIEFSENGWSLRLVRRAGDAPLSEPTASSEPARAKRPARAPSAQSSAAAKGAEIAAPLFGVVYLRPGPDAPDFVSPGQAVTAGSTVCVIEAMKVFHQVRAERDGIVAALLVTSGEEVEAGQILLRLE